MRRSDIGLYLGPAERADPDLILWDMHRHMDTDRMPSGRTVIRFDFTDQPAEKRRR